MIKKERLEELIEQGATIWNDRVLPINLISFKQRYDDGFYSYKTYLKNNYLVWEVTGDYDSTNAYPFENLFETKEDAEEYAEFDNITKTERLKLPTWSDIFPDKENHFYHGTYNCWWDDCCKYDIYINAFITDNNFEKGYFDINGHREFGITKESYTNIRRYAVKLFYGEEV